MLGHILKINITTKESIYMDMAQPDFPFRQSIELAKQVPETGFRYHWKAEVNAPGLIISMWLGGSDGTPFERSVTRTIKSQECKNECPIQEMWYRVLVKIDRQDFIIVNGN